MLRKKRKSEKGRKTFWIGWIVILNNGMKKGLTVATLEHWTSNPTMLAANEYSYPFNERKN